MKKIKPERFKMLKTISMLLKILGWIALFAGLAAAVEVLVAPGMVSKLGLLDIYQSTWLLALVVMMGAVLYAMIFFALSEGVIVFLSIESNTRKLRELLDKK
ncbi:hypothetical protein KJ836_03680 [Patescibacteria group bacterium]|nr:hypothetical protein [Patescibacteria group bacterium]